MKRNFLLSLIGGIVVLGLGILFMSQIERNTDEITTNDLSGSTNTTIHSGKVFDPSLPAGGMANIIPSQRNLEVKIEPIQQDKIDKNPLLINDLIANRLYLMKKDGIILYEWNLGKRMLGNDAIILPGGKLLASRKSISPRILLGGYGGVTEIIGTGSETLWKFELSSSGVMAHHDTEILPNGNILMLVWGKIEKQDVKKYGYKSEMDIYPERIVEVNPKTNEIVWRWDSMDHVIQDKDPKARNYGDVAKKPEKIDLNYADSQSGMIMHANGLVYDKKNDLIYLSVYNFSEVWAIDHSTTKEEVKTGKGGKYNRGGDLVYRFGNPAAYRGTGTRLLYSSHHPSFTKEGTFLLYSNGIRANPEQATAYEFQLPKELDEKKSTLSPPGVVWSFTHPEIFFDKVGGVTQALNGNFIITEGDGRIWEVTREKEIVWKYNLSPSMLWRTYVYPYGSSELNSLGIRE